jgi:hypothetical protein
VSCIQYALQYSQNTIDSARTAELVDVKYASHLFGIADHNLLVFTQLCTYASFAFLDGIRERLSHARHAAICTAPGSVRLLAKAEVVLYFYPRCGMQMAWSGLPQQHLASSTGPSPLRPRQ